jgi:hypothetical protein
MSYLTPKRVLRAKAKVRQAKKKLAKRNSTVKAK